MDGLVKKFLKKTISNAIMVTIYFIKKNIIQNLPFIELYSAESEGHQWPVGSKGRSCDSSLENMGWIDQ